MTHEKEKFVFADNEGKKVELTTKPWCFDLEDTFKEFIGDEKYNEYQKSRTVELELNRVKVSKYFPLLLDAPARFNFKRINWGKQDYDLMLKVVSFFLDYRRNATLRLLQSQKETVASVIHSLETISNLKLANILTPNLSASMADSSLQETQSEN